MQVRQQAREPGHLADLQPPVTENGGQPGAKASSAPVGIFKSGTLSASASMREE